MQMQSSCVAFLYIAHDQVMLLCGMIVAVWKNWHCEKVWQCKLVSATTVYAAVYDNNKTAQIMAAIASMLAWKMPVFPPKAPALVVAILLHAVCRVY